MNNDTRKSGIPTVKEAKSFREIVENFTDPREIVREAISNALDWGATTVEITVNEDMTRADKELVIHVRDDGVGLNEERFYAFWNLADSPQLQKDAFGKKTGSRIGEKGHGTKTYWKCRKLELESIASEIAGSQWHVIAEMNDPINTLIEGKIPLYYYADSKVSNQSTFTEIIIKGYYVRDREDFRHESLKDYIQWFTKFGSIELELGIETYKGKKLHLQGLGKKTPELIEFGHIFPPQANNVRQLQKQYQDSWPKFYVNKWYKTQLAIDGYPSSSIDIVFYIEGDTIKRQYNDMLTRPFRKTETWHYTASDRYGLYVCKDWIPLPPSQRVNEWVAEKSEWTLYHAFVNCQDFQLTANRASIGNTDRVFLSKVREAVSRFFGTEVKASPEYRIYKDEIASTKEKSVKERTEQDEKTDLDYRFDRSKNKRTAALTPGQVSQITLFEPRQEAEVLTLFTIVSIIKPDLFNFKIVDYCTSRGIDALCVLETGQGGLQRGNIRYVEFKRVLTHDFGDHTFSRLAAIVCWECNLPSGAKIQDLLGQERTLHISKDTSGVTLHMLLSPPNIAANNIRVYVLKEYLRERLGLNFQPQES